MSFHFPPDIYYSYLTKGIDANGNPILVDKTPTGLKLTGTRDAQHPVSTHPENKGLLHVGKSIFGDRDPKADPDPGSNPATGCKNCSVQDGIASIPCQIEKAACEAQAGIGSGFGAIGKGFPTIFLLGGAALLLILLIKK